MTFLETIFERLQQAASAPVIREVRGGKVISVTGDELLVLVRQARTFFVARGLKKGDRCALLAPNSIRWAALDLAMMAEGIIVVPLYARQAPAELVAMMKDSTPARVCCADAVIAAEIQKLWPGGPKVSLLESVFIGDAVSPTPPNRHADSDAVTIIYTSGTSGEPKGVVLNSANVTYMLGCTNARLDQLMAQFNRGGAAPDHAFHYLPFSFAASWLLLLTALSRNSVLTLSHDLSKLADELKIATPDYFLNVPTLLERVRRRIEETLQQRGGFAAKVFSRAQQAYLRRQKNESRFPDGLWLWTANRMMFPAIRSSVGVNLKALICGSAPLALETQLFYMMIGIPVLQAYGLTETTGICTLDDPQHVEPGRVGDAGRIGLDRETELPAHIQHRRVFLKHLARYSFQSFGFGVFDDQLHQYPAEPPALEIGPEQDRVFTALVDRIRVYPNHANQLIGGFVERNKSHRTGVVELGQPGDEFMGKLLHRREEPQPQILAGDVPQ